jgi:hypothetical protein
MFLILALLPFANGLPFSKQSVFSHCSAAEVGTEGAGGFDLALGLARHAEQLADETGSLTYTQALGDATFAPENFATLANETRTILYDPGIRLGQMGPLGEDSGIVTPYLEHVTNYELHQVLTNPSGWQRLYSTDRSQFV